MSDDAVFNLPPLRDVISRYELSAQKKLGQNFLLDLNLTSKIARQAGHLNEGTVIEVGPGPGGLTRGLLMNDARSVIAIEKDPRCVMALQELIDAANGRLNVIEGDALELDLEALALPPRKIVANLPYNVGTLLLINWLKQAEKFQSLTLMFQKEVAERIIAQPGDKHYGRLSVLAHWRCHTELCFILPPKAFSPPPKVESAIIHLTPRTPAPTDCHLDDLEKVTGAAFGQRRKMLRKSLQTLDVAADHLLEKTGIDGTRRAETLEVAEFVMLAATYRTISIDKRNKTED